MNTKRIIFLSPFFYPEPISTGKFNTDVVKDLSSKGYRLTVICSHPFYPKWKPRKSGSVLDGIDIIRGGSKIKYPQKTIPRRILLEVWYALFVFRHIISLRNKVDVLIPVFPPSLAFYFILPIIKKSTQKIGLVHDLQDIYVSNKKGLFNNLIRLLIHRVEKRSFKACNKLIFLSNGMKLNAKNSYSLDDKKLDTHYPFINIDTVNLSDDLEEVLPVTEKHIVYSGALGEKQSPKKLYEFFDFASRKVTKTNFHFFSRGFYFEELRKQNTNPKIKFHDLVDEKNLAELYFRATVQIIPQKEGTSLGSLPSKLPNILASGSEILLITDKNSELEKLFDKYDLGCVATLWNNEELCSKLESILDNKGKNRSYYMKIAKELFSIDRFIDLITKDI